MKTLIFEYKGRLGIQAGDKFLNDPTKSGQLGCIVDLKEVDISAEALQILKGVKKSHDAVGDVMCWMAGEQGCFGWLGVVKKYLLHPEAEADRNYHPELLESRVTLVEAPEDFKKVIDKKSPKTKNPRRLGGAVRVS